MSFFGPAYKAEYPLNWVISSVSAPSQNNIRITNGFYDPVFSGVIETNGALDRSTTTTADVTFSPSENMVPLLNQTAIVASSTTTNDYGYIPYIVEVDGALPLLVNMNDTITANTSKVVVRSIGACWDGAGCISQSLTSNQLAGKKCYLRRVLCFYELSTRPSGISLESGSLTGNNNSVLSDRFFGLVQNAFIALHLRGDGVTWRKVGSTTNFGNTPVFMATYFDAYGTFRIANTRTARYP